MLKELLLYIHIAAGFSALVAALIAAFNKMFDLTHSWHVYSGRVFLAGMIIIFLTAVTIALMTGDVFLLLVSIFSVYLALSGWSYARNRQGTPAPLDWLRAFGMAAASLVMALYGADDLAPSSRSRSKVVKSQLRRSEPCQRVAVQFSHIKAPRLL